MKDFLFVVFLLHIFKIMREIKFRIWDSKNNSFIPLDVDIIIRFDGRCYFLGGDSVVDNYIIQQYTGLEDKNGFEVYEGDIINTLPRQAVVYYNGSFVLQNPHDELRRLKKLKEHMDSGNNFMYQGCKNSVTHLGSNPHLSVIGNIFENPELLK